MTLQREITQRQWTPINASRYVGSRNIRCDRFLGDFGRVVGRASNNSMADASAHMTYSNHVGLCACHDRLGEPMQTMWVLRS